MFYSPAFIFSSGYSLGFGFLAGLRLLASRQFSVFLQAVRCLRGAVLFRGLRSSSIWGFPFWLLGLTGQSSRPAFGRRLTFVRLHTTGTIGYSAGMAPTIARDGQFRLFFFSREEERIHVHVAHPDGEAKFWLSPQVHLSVNMGLSPSQIRQAQAVVTAHLQEIEDAWRHHFGS